MKIIQYRLCRGDPGKGEKSSLQTETIIHLRGKNEN